jgi:hypothetical protein
MSKQLYCGSSCVKYILENYRIDTSSLKHDMLWASELALSLNKNELLNIKLYYYNSRLYNDFINKKVDLSFDGFKYLKKIQEQNILIEERNISINSFAEEIDSCKYIILCVESRIFYNDDSMSGGHYIILNGRNGENVKVINPIKEKYEIKIFNINFLIKTCKNNGNWRILIKEE